MKSDNEALTNQKHPFTDRVVYASGFGRATKKELTDMIKRHGGKMATQLSKNVHYLLTGPSPSPGDLKAADQLAFNGYHIRRLSVNDINEIEQGNTSPYLTEKEIRKNVVLTIRHFEKYRITFDSRFSPIAGQYVYLGSYSTALAQVLGNIGAIGQKEIDSDTNICLLTQETIDHLKSGQPDPVIESIQAECNRRDIVVFNLLFAAEDELLEFFKKHRQMDDVSINLIKLHLSQK